MCSSKSESILQRYHNGVERLKLKDDVFSDRYVKNIQAFNKYYPDIYDQIISYVPKRNSIFLDEDGGLNIFDEEHETFLFDKPPLDSTIEKVRDYTQAPHRTSLNIKGGRGLTRHEHYMRRLDAFLQKDAYEKQEDLPEYVPSMLMFGLDFGYSLYFLNQSYKIGTLYIYEPDFDFFYYSLFTVEWLEIFEKIEKENGVLHMSVGIDENDFISQYFSYIYTNGLFLAPITYFYFSRPFKMMKKAAKIFSDNYAKQVFGWGFFDDAMMGITHSLEGPNVKNLFLGNSGKLPRNMVDIPIFILANGPSLDQNIEFIKQHKDSVILVSCGTTTNTLHRLGIKPDFHVDVERMRLTVDKLEPLPESYLRDVAALTVNLMHPDFYKLFNKVGVALKPGEASSTLIQKLANKLGVTPPLLMNSGPIVANTALAYFTSFKFRNIYLLGVDCGFKSGDKHHSIHSGYYKDGKSTTLLHYKGAKLSENEGNFGGTVYSDYIFNNSRLFLEESIKESYDRDKLFSCFNMSDGANIKGALPLFEDDFIPYLGKVDKSFVVEYLFESYFIEASFKDAEREFLLVKDELEGLAGFMMSGWSDVESRSDIMKKLEGYNRRIGDCYNGQFPEVFELVIGSYTYFASYLSMFVFQNKFSSDVLHDATEMYDIWCEFLQEILKSFTDLKRFFDEGDDFLMSRYNA
ncbi:motility associated factor glycosyltransferase family protein [Marinomonas atlantica]|uniref:motility associated factor glycosyltransferase family protein n=1 Tax=Marinomonas atlantica TaxID=1806668 RepID=UPI00082DB8CB|nr:6-hydroxymethylpterin diphosphokinase MptE-like protein [Marinomonas atlantica]